jgi:hypothetical protein
MNWRAPGPAHLSLPQGWRPVFSKGRFKGPVACENADVPVAGQVRRISAGRLAHYASIR